MCVMLPAAVASADAPQAWRVVLGAICLLPVLGSLVCGIGAWLATPQRDFRYIDGHMARQDVRHSECSTLRTTSERPFMDGSQGSSTGGAMHARRGNS